MLLDEREVNVEIAQSLQDCENAVITLSAFIKHGALKWFFEQIKSRDINVTVIARWQLGDLIANVSDLSVYEECKKYGWTFKVDQRLHAKLFLIDSSVAFVGSSNLTGAGFALNKKSNFELSTKVEVTDIDVKKVSKYVDSCKVMTDDLYSQMKKVVDNAKLSEKKVKLNKWPLEIQKLLEQRIDYLWIDELLFTSPNSNNYDDIRHDLSLLEIDSFVVDKDLLRVNFTELRVVKWLKGQLLEEESKSLRFGAISSRLHDALLNDPKPYRKNVKDFQVNLFNWLKYLELPDFEFSKYNVSETISLTND